MSAPQPHRDYAPLIMPEPPLIDLAQLEAELTRDRIKDIAVRLRKLTYGEMMELAAEIEASPDTLHKWSKERV
jgi:hypothetical protein